MQLFSTCVLARLCLYGSFCETLLFKSCCVPKEDVCQCRGKAPLGQNPGGGRKVVPYIRDMPSGLVSRNHRSGGVVAADTRLAGFGSRGWCGRRGDAQQPTHCPQHGRNRAVGAGGTW